MPGPQPEAETDHSMDNDDRQVGRILSRREVIALFGTAGAMFLVGCSTGGSDKATATTATSATPPAGTGPATATDGSTATSSGSTATTAATAAQGAASTATTTQAAAAGATVTVAAPACVVSPELTEGPYFVDEMLNRSDIRPDPSTGEVSEGVLLQLIFRVYEMGTNGCTALQGADVDVWQCNALGVYSDVQDPGFNTEGQKFLRGYQTTDADGVARFSTVYPGWYQGRTVHIHFKVRSAAGASQTYEFTSQLFFDDDLTDQVHAEEPYASKGVRTLRNEGDNIYQESNGELTLLCTPTSDGYSGTFDVGMQLS